jgi:hypothetical protein
MPTMPNPYETLQIAATATTAEVAAAGMVLIEAESDDDRKLLYRSAVEALTTHPGERDYHRFWEPCGSRYPDAAEAAFAERYGAAPVDRADLQRRARAFLDEDCSGKRLFEAMVQVPRPPVRIEDCHPAGTIESPLTADSGPGAFFLRLG